MLVNYSIQKVIAIDDENNIIGYSDSGLGIGDITIPKANYTIYDLLKMM